MHKRTWIQYAILFAGLTLASLPLIGCGSTSAAPFSGGSNLPAVTIQISPANAAVTTGSVQPFTATVGNTGNTAVTWMVNGLVGGSAFIGTIDTNGNYTAPLYVPVPNVVTVTAAANANNTQQASATVTVSGTPLPIKVSAQSANLYFGGVTLLTASVQLSNPAVTWEVAGVVGGNVKVGTITPLPGNGNQAIYIAPLQVPAGGDRVPVTAISVENTELFASATITLSSPPANSPEVTLNPSLLNPPTVPTGWVQGFQATVTHASNTNVTWFVDGIPGGNSSVGTIAPGPNDTAVFTAPAQVPNPNQVYVTAASEVQPEAQATTPANVVTAPPLNVTVTQNDPCQNLKSVGPSGQIQFYAKVTGAPNQGVTWGVNQIPGGNSTYGTITSNGLYTAPTTIPSNPNVTIDAVSQLDNKTTGTLPVILASVPVAAVTISPASATVETCYTCDDLVPNAKHSRKKGFQPEDQYPTGASFTATTQFSGALLDYALSWSVTNNGQDNGAVDPQPQQNGAIPCQYIADYDAPPSVPTPNKIQVTATSVADPQASASATVTIVQGPQYSVPALQPSSVTVPEGQSQTFTAYVYDDGQYNPNIDQNVTWTLSSTTVDCSAAGNPCGTVNPTFGNGQSGCCQGLYGTLYTAPSIITQGFTVTLTATAQIDSAASNSATITLPNGVGSIAINPSSAGCPADANSSDPCSDNAPVVSFNVSTQNLSNSDTVTWSLSCISWNDGYDACKSTYYEHGNYNNNYDGPGCISATNVQGNPEQECAEAGIQNIPLSGTMTYLPPENLYGKDYLANGCSIDDGTNGYVVISADVADNNCPNGQCNATACIKICPAGTSPCTAPGQQ